ncbi:TPA: hypothetical protein DIC20_00240 [Candidatus Dependentiae bacterium]|nr:hypothetical protein [Candidatus Dependentiae bacterium]
MSNFNNAIDNKLLDKIVYGDIAAPVEPGEIFYQLQRRDLAISLFMLPSQCGWPKAIKKLADIEQLIHRNKKAQKEDSEKRERF